MTTASVEEARSEAPPEPARGAPGGEEPPARETTPAPSPAAAAERGSLARFFGNTWAIAKKELSVYFTTPIAWVLFAMWTLILSYFFVVFVQQYLEYTMRAQQFAQFQPGMLDQLNFTDMIFTPMLGNAGVVLIFIVPFLSMRLIAEEKRQQTFQLLMTTPVRSWEIVLGKYISSLLVVAFAIGLTLAYPVILDKVAESGGVEWQTAWVGYLGLFLLAAAFMAIGLFISSLTESQTVAAAVTFGVLLLMWVLSWASGSTDGYAKDILERVCALTHLRSFLKGTLNLADAAYFGSVVVLGLYMTRTAIERSRW